MPTQNYTPDQSASPYVRYSLAMGTAPPGRVRGWVSAMATGGADNVPEAELIARHGQALRAECLAAGFEPDCDVPLAKQSREARQAASAWAEHVVREGQY